MASASIGFAVPLKIENSSGILYRALFTTQAGLSRCVHELALFKRVSGQRLSLFGTSIAATDSATTSRRMDTFCGKATLRGSGEVAPTVRCVPIRPQPDE
jgi:hypothetical protein